MYSRDFGGIKSDGQLHNMRQELYENAHRQEEPLPQPEHHGEKTPNSLTSGLFDKVKDIFKSLQIDDLILIAIGVLLLLDGDSGNDMLVIFILVLLLF